MTTDGQAVRPACRRACWYIERWIEVQTPAFFQASSRHGWFDRPASATVKNVCNKIEGMRLTSTTKIRWFSISFYDSVEGQS
jgi:hypothetical protein